jgi:hypothetical protein
MMGTYDVLDAEMVSNQGRGGRARGTTTSRYFENVPDPYADEHSGVDGTAGRPGKLAPPRQSWATLMGVDPEAPDMRTAGIAGYGGQRTDGGAGGRFEANALSAVEQTLHRAAGHGQPRLVAPKESYAELFGWLEPERPDHGPAARGGDFSEYGESDEHGESEPVLLAHRRGGHGLLKINGPGYLVPDAKGNLNAVYPHDDSQGLGTYDVIPNGPVRVTPPGTSPKGTGAFRGSEAPVTGTSTGRAHGIDFSDPKLFKPTNHEERQRAFDALKRLAAESGDPHPDLAAAQWAHESGWGSHPSGRFNLFGIKSRHGEPGTVVATHERINGVLQLRHHRFVDYASPEAGVVGHTDFVLHRLLHCATADYVRARTWEEAFQALVKGEYFSDDPELYHKDVRSILRTYNH